MKTFQNDKAISLLMILRIAVGLLFIFSGLVKLNDPLGFAYKLDEYFDVFHLSFLSSVSVFLSVAFCALEVILGAFLLLGYRAVLTVWGLLVLILFFSFLTFYSAAFDAVKSCGCFGDAIPLTPWQSFFKDIVLLVLILVIFKGRHHIKPLFKSSVAMNTAALASVVLSTGFGIYTYTYLPVIDFLPYHKGADLISYMSVPEDAQLDEYQITYTLKNTKTGEVRKMSDKEYMDSGIWEDSSWIIEGEPNKKLLKQGYKAKISDLIITDAQGVDFTSELISNPYYNLVIVAYDLSGSNAKALQAINLLSAKAQKEYNIRTVLLTSSSPQEVSVFFGKHTLSMETFYADAVPLKSMIRSNPGILLLKEGVVLNKWPQSDVPSYNYLIKSYFSKPQKSN